MTNYLNKYIGKIIKGLATGFRLKFINGSLFPYYKSNTFGTSFKSYISNIVSSSSDNLTTGFVTANILYDLSNNNYIDSNINYENGYQLIIANYLNTIDYITKPIDLQTSQLNNFKNGDYSNSPNIGNSISSVINVPIMSSSLNGVSNEFTSANDIFTYYWDKFLDISPLGETDTSNTLLNIIANDISNTLYYFIDLSNSTLTDKQNFRNDNSSNFIFDYNKLETINNILNTGTTIDIKKIIKIILSFTLSRYQYIKLNSLITTNPYYNDIKLYEYSDIYDSNTMTWQTNYINGSSIEMKYKVTYTFYDLYKIKSGFPVDQDTPYSITEISDILKLYMKIFMSANSDLKSTFETINAFIELESTNPTSTYLDEDFYEFLVDINNVYNLFETPTTSIAWSDVSDNIISNINFWVDNSYIELNDYLYLKDNFRVNLFKDWKKFTENRIITNI